MVTEKWQFSLCKLYIDQARLLIKKFNFLPVFSAFRNINAVAYIGTSTQITVLYKHKKINLKNLI
jgi:hypothetical protein